MTGRSARWRGVKFTTGQTLERATSTLAFRRQPTPGMRGFTGEGSTQGFQLRG